MSRIKILLLVLIIVVLSIIFVQNQQPITLKLLCADRNQNCLYQTPSLPLAVWIAIATLTGAIANLLIQALDRFGYNNSNRKSSTLDEDLYSDGTSLRDEGNRTRNTSTKYSPTTNSDRLGDDVNSYEVKQEPQNIERSGSTYSYKYREVGKKSDYPKGTLRDRSNNKNSVEPEINSNTNSESDDEDWI